MDMIGGFNPEDSTLCGGLHYVVPKGSKVVTGVFDEQGDTKGEKVFVLQEEVCAYFEGLTNTFKVIEFKEEINV